MKDVKLVMARRINKTRKEKEMSLANLADITGLSKSRISNYENMIRTPSVQVIYILAEGLGVDPGYLLGLDYFFPEHYGKQT